MFVTGQAEIVKFLIQKWERGLGYALGKELWGIDGNGLMSRREASINDIPTQEKGRRIFGPRTGPGHPRNLPVH